MTGPKDLLEGAPSRPIRVPKAGEIFREGDRADALFRVDAGCVRLETDQEDGRRDVIAFLFPGDTFLAGLETRWASAYAVSASTLSRFTLRQLLDGREQDRTGAVALLSSIDEMLHDIIHRVALLSHATANARVAWFLGWLDERIGGDFPDEVHLPMTQRDIADFLGIAPETVSRVFRSLEASGQLRRTPDHRFRFRKNPDRNVTAVNAQRPGL